MRLRTHVEASLWLSADGEMEPVLGDYATAGALLGMLEEVLVGKQYRFDRRVDPIKNGWCFQLGGSKAFYEEADTIGAALAAALLQVWNK